MTSPKDPFEIPTDPIEAIETIFGLSPREIRAFADDLRSVLNRDDLWDRQEIADFISETLTVAGIPSNPNLHQQPHDFARIFRLKLRSYQSNLEGDHEGHDIVVNRFLLCLWLIALTLKLDEYKGDGRQIIEEAEFTALQLLHYFGPRDQQNRSIETNQSKFWADWFLDTLGCFDLDSGNLVDPDHALENSLAREVRGAEIRERLRSREERGK